MATYTVVNSGGSINNSATFSPAGIPGAADTIVFSATSGQLTVNVTTTIQDINFSNYTNVITFNAPLNISRNITFGDLGGLSTYTVAGTNALVKTGTGTLTSNGKIWPGNFTFGTGANYTVNLQDKISISGTTTVSGLNITITLSSNNVFDPERFDVLGDFVVSGTGIILAPGSGGALIKFTGTANQSVSWTATGQVRTDVKIDKTGGTLTFSGTINYNTGTFTYVQGTVNSGTSTLAIANATTTMNTNGSTAGGATTTSSTGINWYRLTLSTTLNLTSNFTVINTLTANVGTITRSSTQNVYLGGSLTMTSTLTSTAAAIIMNGSGTWSGAGVVTAPLTFNTIGGTIIISGNVYFSTRTLTYTAADTIDTTNSTLNINDSCTLNTNGITWNNISAGLNFTNPTITLSSNLTWSGTMSLMNNQLSVNGVSRTVTFSGVGALSPTLVANVSIGNYGFGSNGGSTIVNFPVSTVLSITNLTIGAGGTTAAGYNCTVNNVTFNVSGIFEVQTVNQNISRFNGTSSQINMTGNSCTISHNIITGGNVIYISIPVTINTPGTVTLSANNTTIVYFETTVTYTAGTISGSVTAVFVTCTLNLNAGGQWGTNVTIRGATTLTSNATFGNLTTDTTVVTFSGAFTINVKGNLAINTTTSGASTPIVLNGTGAQTWSHSSAVYLSNNLTINKASGTLTVSGNVYYVTGTLTYTASGGTVTTTGSTIVFNGTTTIATNGITWNNVQLGGASPTYTLTNNFTIGGTLTLNASGTETVSGSILYLASLSHTGALCQGTTTFTFYTTGTWSTAGGNALRNPTIIDTSSNTLTIASQIRYDTGTLTYTSGTVDTTTNSSTIIFSANVTLATNGITWYNVTINVASVLTLTNDFVWGNNFSIITAVAVSFAGVGNLSPTTTANLVLSTTSTFTPKNNIQINNATVFGTINTNTISISGNLTVNGTTSGTTNLILNGSGAQSWTHGSAVYLSNNLTINKSGGTLTIGPNVYYNTRTLTYTAGTVDTTTNNSTLNCNASTTFVTNGMSWRNVTLSGTSQTFTFTNDFTLTGTLTLSGTTAMSLTSSSINTGGLTITTTATVSGISSINFTGTGTWNHSAAGYLLNNVNINTSGTLTLGANIYYSVNTITYISGTVDSVTNSNTLNILLSSVNTWTTVGLNTDGISWYNLTITAGTSGVGFSITLLSALNVLNTLTIYNNNAIQNFTGSNTISCYNLIIQGASGNNSIFNFNGNNIYTTNLTTASVTAGTNSSLNNANLYISGDITIGSATLLAPLAGTVEIYYVGSGTWRALQNNVGQVLAVNFTLNTGGVLTLSGNVYYSTKTFTHLKGRISARNSTFNITAASTFIGCNKSNFDRVVITSGINVTMNEFFCGTPGLKTTVSPSSTTNYNIIFNDALEKLAFYVKVNRATISRTNQLTIVTDRGNNLNNVGIKFAPNQLPNGLPKNNPLVSNPQQLSSFLVSEPIYN